jgi:hypothetical protein
MTRTDIDNGIVIVEIGIAPVKPAEFVIVRISQRAGQGRGRRAQAKMPVLRLNAAGTLNGGVTIVSRYEGCSDDPIYTVFAHWEPDPGRKPPPTLRGGRVRAQNAASRQSDCGRRLQARMSR